MLVCVLMCRSLRAACARVYCMCMCGCVLVCRSVRVRVCMCLCQDLHQLSDAIDCLIGVAFVKWETELRRQVIRHPLNVTISIYYLLCLLLFLILPIPSLSK